MRKPSPISTSSPRLTMISRPWLRASAHSSSAAALLFTTWTAWASGTAAASASSAPRPRRARRPVASANSTSVASGGDGERVPGRGRQRRSAQVGVDDHAGRVDHAPKARRVRRQRVDRGRGDLLRRDVAAAGPVLRRDHGLLHHLSAEPIGGRRQLGAGEQHIRRRDEPSPVDG